MNGTNGRVYGGDPAYVHIPDGKRQGLGEAIAEYAELLIRASARYAGQKGVNAKPICPGCYMVALYNAALTLAERNGQSRQELCRSMARAFSELATSQPYNREEIHVEQAA